MVRGSDIDLVVREAYDDTGTKLHLAVDLGGDHHQEILGKVFGDDLGRRWANSEPRMIREVQIS